MLVSSSGKLVGLEKGRNQREAEAYFFERLESDPVLFYRHQLSWIKQTELSRLGPEFGGALYPGKIATFEEAGQLLARLTKGELKQIDIRRFKRMPIVEGLIRFRSLTYSYLKDGEPTLFFRSGRRFSLTEVRYTYKLSPIGAANYILNRIDGV